MGFYVIFHCVYSLCHSSSRSFIYFLQIHIALLKCHKLFVVLHVWHLHEMFSLRARTVHLSISPLAQCLLPVMFLMTQMRSVFLIFLSFPSGMVPFTCDDLNDSWMSILCLVLGALTLNSCEMLILSFFRN